MIKIGDKVRVIKNKNGNDFYIGELVTITEITPHNYKCENKDDNWKLTRDEFELAESKPKQYKKGIDTMCRAESNMSLNERLGAVKWNIDKYNWRDKGQDREDFIKIKAYCDYAIKQLDNERKQ